MSRAVVWLGNNKHWAEVIYCRSSHHLVDGAPSSSFGFIHLVDGAVWNVGRQQGLGRENTYQLIITHQLLTARVVGLLY